MMTSKERAALRGQANTIDVTLMVGKGGVSDAHELVKSRVLEAAMLTAREACDALCEATGADGVQVVGGTFVIYRKSEKLERARKAAEQTKKTAAKKVNPVKASIQARRRQAKADKERRQKYFHDAAVKAAIERRKQSEQ